MHRTIRGLILDIDGTLVDSNEAHALSWIRALQENGLSVTLDEVCRLIGMGSDKLLPALCAVSLDSEQGMRISSRKKEIFNQQFLPELRPTPGAERLLRKLRQLGLRLGVASSAGEEDLHHLLALVHGEELIPEKASKDNSGASKPAPDTVETALRKLGIYPAETLMLGDTPYDIEAARRAGVQTIALRCGGWQDAELPGALAIYDHPLDLLENLESSPLQSVLLARSA